MDEFFELNDVSFLFGVLMPVPLGFHTVIAFSCLAEVLFELEEEIVFPYKQSDDNSFEIFKFNCSKRSSYYFATSVVKGLGL